MDEITLQPVSRDNWRQALKLSLFPEQQHFVADVTPPVAIALAKAYIQPGHKNVAPFAIYAGDRMVGFFNLHYTAESVDDYWIFHFFIDKDHQRQGYGQAALSKLIERIRTKHPHCERIRLTVNPNNHAAQAFYRKMGFVSDGQLAYGEPIYTLTLQDVDDYK
ncbi:MAG: GNAT family N-acetyltransferase [Ardenticatenaceae bacterium]